jgi:AraC-like DNA-binding protein
MDALLLEIMARGIAIGAMVAVGAGLWAGNGGAHARIAGVLFTIGVIAYAINSSAPLRHAIGPVLPLVHFLAFAGAGSFWLFVTTLFEDRPLTWLRFAPIFVLTGLGIIGQVVRGGGVWIVHNLVEAALAVHALYVIARSWRGDLVEARRRLRGPFLAAAVLFTLFLSGAEIGQILGYDAWWNSLAFAMSLALFCVAGATVFLVAKPELFGAAAAPTPLSDGLDSGDRATLERLNALMADGAWRREGLTIGGLAETVGVPEHRLRRLINDHLGFRNFAAFVNVRRIEAAKAVLADPAQARVSVATIAFDLGFGSLGPFNRAFKDETGVTPTQFRRQALGEGSPIPENPR